MDKGTCEPHHKLIYIYKIREEQFWQWPNVFFLFFNFLLFFFFLIHGVLIVGIRWAKNESSSTRRGLRVSTKNTGFHREFKYEVRKILSFSIFSYIYGILTVRICRTKRQS